VDWRLCAAKWDGVARLRRGNNEMRAGAFDTRVALDFGENPAWPQRAANVRNDSSAIAAFFPDTEDSTGTLHAPQARFACGPSARPIFC